jgi:hypothetical protein
MAGLLRPTQPFPTGCPLPLAPDVPLATGDEIEDGCFVPHVGSHYLGPAPGGVCPNTGLRDCGPVDEEMEFPSAGKYGDPVVRTEVIEHMIRDHCHNPSDG